MKMQIFDHNIAIFPRNDYKISSNYHLFRNIKKPRGFTFKDVNKKFEEVFQKNVNVLLMQKSRGPSDSASRFFAGVDHFENGRHLALFFFDSSGKLRSYKKAFSVFILFCSCLYIYVVYEGRSESAEKQ